MKKIRYFKKDIKVLNLGDRTIFSFIANKFYAKNVKIKDQSLLNGSYYELGYKILSPLLLGISIYLINHCKNNQIKDVFFYQRMVI